MLGNLHLDPEVMTAQWNLNLLRTQLKWIPKQPFNTFQTVLAHLSYTMKPPLELLAEDDLPKVCSLMPGKRSPTVTELLLDLQMGGLSTAVGFDDLQVATSTVLCRICCGCSLWECLHIGYTLDTYTKRKFGMSVCLYVRVHTIDT